MASKLEEFVESFPWVQATDIPWTPFNGDLTQSKLAIISTGGVYVRGDKPFAVTTREDVDESFREIPADTPPEELRLGHEHYNKDYARQDINTVFPVQRAGRLVQQGLLGGLSEVNFSITGYIPRPSALYDSGREIGQKLHQLQVDIALIVPV